MRAYLLQIVFCVLLTILWVGTRMTSARPRTPREWLAIKATIGFLAWLLLGFASVRGF